MTSPRVRWIAERLAKEEISRMGLPGPCHDLMQSLALRWLPVAEAIAAEIERHVRAECVRKIEGS